MAETAFIIGAGLAGICLAHQLTERGLDVTLLDTGSNHSSAIAAGLVNPMVFRRMNKSWRLDEFLPESRDFYQQIEIRLQQDFYHPIPIRRFFSSVQEHDLWVERSQQPEFKAYLEPITPADFTTDIAHNPFGSGRVKQAYWIAAEKWVHENQVFFSAQKRLNKESFQATSWDARTRTYAGKTYDFVIFCMGYQQKDEATFSYLPLQQTKGQTLLIESKLLPENLSLNRKCFVLPQGQQQFRVGATYEWNNPSTTLTTEAKEQLLANLEVLGQYEPLILEQKAGVRPTVLDRRPLMGEHPAFKGVYIFNGLGTKGYMMAPTLSRELAEHLLENKPLHPETDIHRFRN
ncbi:MAG: hypothetical protein RLZZ301_435 [Bacteroidota bacterium]|jgi:glycine/D-amino acid oxidase-like deaminating enzyme